jgi:hypothetical protein
VLIPALWLLIRGVYDKKEEPMLTVVDALKQVGQERRDLARAVRTEALVRHIRLEAPALECEDCRDALLNIADEIEDELS